ncbi:MAG: SDR family NAD(P)-dependent oxidoreductase [Candidatus Cloacimonetes bacterium]|nr:SDR family NAD(P)-dependent oxidoreductase [Candidatus Cloacimonadota bacterium]
MAVQGKKVLVTGAEGFIGSHLVEELILAGASVRAVVQYNSLNNWGWLENLSCLSEVEVISGDVRDFHFCKLATNGIEQVFHLAALIAIPFSYTAPNMYIDTNVNGTLNMCLAASEQSCERFIQTSTSEVYGSAIYVPIDEKHPLQAQSPYSASKIGADAIAMSCHKSYNLPITIARPFNAYGPRQSARAIIPTIITQILSGKKEILLGDLTPTRDFNYVKDTCQGFIKLAESTELNGEVVNIASNSEISMGAVLDLIKELIGNEVEFKLDPKRIRPEKSEVNRLFGDNTKLISKTTFQSNFTLRQGLSETIKWFKIQENLSKYKADIYNV